MLGKKIINTGGGVACTTDTTQILDGGTTQSTALYRFEDNANDTASSTGKFNKGGIFNGSSSKIDLPDNILPDNSSGSSSASVWFKSSFGNTAGDSECILDAYAYDTNKPGWGLFMEPAYGGNPDGHLYLANYSLGGTSGGTSTSYRDGNWHHAVVVLDNPNNTIKVYLDGNSSPVLSQTASAAYVWPFTEKAAIGYQNANASYPRYFNGGIDQVRIFNKALSTSEITTLYNETTTTANTLQVLSDTSCVAAYTFEGNANDLDTSTPKNGTASNVIYDYSGTASNITYAAGKFDKAAVFNGSSSRVDLPTGDLGFGTNNFSISLWFNSADITQDNQGLFWFQHYQSSMRIGVGLSQAAYGGDGDIRFYCMIGGASYNANTNSDILSSNTWYHAVFVKSSTSGMTIYINGSSVATNTSATGAVNTNMTSGGANVIGAYQTTSSSNYFNGSIDQFRTFNKVLSAGEINSLYNETTTTAALSTISNPSTIAYYKMADATDETGSYNGTATDVDFNVEGKYGFAGKFNGSSSRINTGLIWPGGTQISWSFWVNTAGGVNQYLFGDFNDSGSNNSSRLAAQFHSSNVLYILTNNGSTGTTTNAGSIASYLNKWTHVAITVNGTEVKAYLDGSLFNTHTGTAITAGANPFVIGAYTNNSSRQNVNGKIDQVRIFNKVISADEVTKLYNEVQCANTITTPESYFNTVLYTGNRPNTQSITGVGFKPDFVWVKLRSASGYGAVLANSVSGAQKFLDSSNNSAEVSAANSLTSFDTDGFSVGGYGNWNGGANAANGTMVSWNWKAAAANTTNNDGSTASTVRASQESGFSIVKTPSTSGAITFGHGLGTEPAMIINKGLTAAGWAWLVYHKDIGTGKYIKLNDSGVVVTNAGSFSSVTSTTITNNSGNSSQDYINYCFANVDGYQRIGSYAGNGSANGPSVFTGFEPAWVIIKRTDTADNWIVYDNKRNTALFPNLNSAELSGYNNLIKFVSNGFTVNTTDSSLNNSSGNYIFLAIAANPDTTVPTKANSFKTKLYTGTGSAQSITGFGFKPDFIWTKNRGAAASHYLFDSVRGVGKEIYSDLTAVEYTSSATVTSFDSDGFSVGTNNGVNQNSNNYVAWAWKGLDHDRNLAAINTDGNITSLVSANTAAGFSIITYSPNNTVGMSIGHGLSQAPQIVFSKRLDSAVDWGVYTNVSTGNTTTNWLSLNDADAYGSGSYMTLNTTTLELPATGAFWASASSNQVAYCWHSVSGYSSIGTYTGNGSTTGPSVTVGFRPSWVLIKRTSDTANWYIFDAVRSGSTTAFPKALYASLNNAEYDTTGTIYDGMHITTTATTFEVDFSSAWTNLNASGSTYLYMAFK